MGQPSPRCTSIFSVARAFFILLVIPHSDITEALSISSESSSLQPFEPLLLKHGRDYFRMHFQQSSRFTNLDQIPSSRQTPQGPTFSSGPVDSEVFVSMINQEAQAQLFYIFVPEESYSIDDYNVVPSIGNPLIIEDEDVNIVAVEDSSAGYLAYNISVEIDFNKWTGVTTFSLDVLNITTSEVVTSSLSATLTAVGMTFFIFDTSTSQSSIIGGALYPLSFLASDLISDNDINLGVFIQYPDGSNSNTSMTIPLDGITISTSGLAGQLNYSNSCDPTSGTYNGNDVTLSQSCGMAFSTNQLNGAYAPPNFGFDFNPYYNGSFTTTFEWNELVIGTDLELDGYTNFIDVQISGEVPPIVKVISPDGPFQTFGGDEVIVNLQNLPSTVGQAQLWTYTLSIDFGDEVKDATLKENSLIVHDSNGTLSMVFTLPAGAGIDLPWTFIATKPDGEKLTAVDQTNPTYLFNFETQIVISTISPNSGSEGGGISVTLTGEFPGAESGNVIILFDGIAIDSSLITSMSSSSITFTLPSRESVNADFDVSITISVNSSESNAVAFTYIPAIALESITPSTGSFEGGTEVTLTGQFGSFDPATEGTGIYFGTVQIDSSLILSFSSTTIVFNTPPLSFFQTNSVLVYDVSVQVNGDSSNSLQFLYEVPLEITSLSPSSGEEAGGTQVTLEGIFTNFDLATSGLYFGGLEINSYIVSYTDSVIVFTTPPRVIVGSAYSYQVWISVDTSISNSLAFTYEDASFEITIDSSGGNLNTESGIYEFGACTDSFYRAWISTGARTQDAKYKWTLTVSGEETDILESQNPQVITDAEVFFLRYELLVEQNVNYNLTVVVTTSFSSASKSILILRRPAQSIGVRIYDPRPRSISDPNITLTIPADIGIPGCRDSDILINSTAMTFVWGFRGDTYTFSYLNTSAPEGEISPTLLGREFHIPQELMAYGNFSLSLTAFFTEQPEIRGSDSTLVLIEPASLIAQINAGQTSQFVSTSQSFTLSAAESRDPDVLEGDISTGLSFSWSCRYSSDSSLDSAVVCPDELLSSSNANTDEFTLSSDELRSVHNPSGDVYIEYSLRVQKTSQNATGHELFRESETTTSTLVLVQEEAHIFEELLDITVVNNQSVTVDTANIKYYEDVIITPISETAETTWTFELISPSSQARRLLSSDENLLSLPGYYTAGSEAARLSLGIKANALSSNTEYRFLISTFRASSEVTYEVNEEVLSLKTVEKPTVTLSNPAKRVGVVDDTFVLSAFTNYDGDFKFFFILTDEFGFENCVGGCQGQDLIRFTLATAGEYSVRCNVYDSLGYTLLATSIGENLTVTNLEASVKNLTTLSLAANNSFLAGDHADYQQYGVDMVKLIWSNGESSSPDLDSEILANFTGGMNQVAANAVPNSIQGAGYVRTVAALATLTPDMGITYSTETLYALVNITVNALERTPDTGALQQLEELLEFYDLTPELVLSTYSTGSSRQRLRQETYDPDREVRALWLDLYEVMQYQLAISVLKRCSCGCVEEISTGVKNREGYQSLASTLSARNSVNLSAAASYVNPYQGQVGEVRFRLAHFCNFEQGLQLILDEGKASEVRFSWCKDVFQDSIKKLYFVLATTPDYVYLSGLYTNVVVSRGLVSTMVTQIQGNGMVDAALPIDQCYNVQIPILRNLTLNAGDFPSEQQPEGLRLDPRKTWGNNGTSGLYIPDFSDISTETRDTEATQGTDFVAVVLKLKDTGVLTVATRIAWGGAAFSLEGILILLAEVLGVTITVFILVLLTTLGAWFVAARLFVIQDTLPPIEAADFTYLQRDVHGRGTAIYLDEEEEDDGGMQRASQMAQ